MIHEVQYRLGEMDRTRRVIIEPKTQIDRNIEGDSTILFQHDDLPTYMRWTLNINNEDVTINNINGIALREEQQQSVYLTIETLVMEQPFMDYQLGMYDLKRESEIDRLMVDVESTMDNSWSMIGYSFANFMAGELALEGENGEPARASDHHEPSIADFMETYRIMVTPDPVTFFNMMENCSGEDLAEDEFDISVKNGNKLYHLHPLVEERQTPRYDWCLIYGYQSDMTNNEIVQFISLINYYDSQSRFAEGYDVQVNDMYNQALFFPDNQYDAGVLVFCGPKHSTPIPYNQHDLFRFYPVIEVEVTGVDSFMGTSVDNEGKKGDIAQHHLGKKHDLDGIYGLWVSGNTEFPIVYLPDCAAYVSVDDVDSLRVKQLPASDYESYLAFQEDLAERL